MAQSVTKAQRERWFTEGAAALRRTLSGVGMADSLPDSEFYACPLCLVAYGRNAFEAGVFTVEHVSPHSAGGDPLLLTCERCNSTAGTAMDSHAAGREAVDDLFAGRSLRRALRAAFDVGGRRPDGARWQPGTQQADVTVTGPARLLLLTLTRRLLPTAKPPTSASTATPTSPSTGSTTPPMSAAVGCPEAPTATTKGTFDMTPVRDAVIGEATDGAGRLRPRTFNLIERTDESGDDQQVA